MKEKQRGIGMSSTSATRTSFLRIGTTWIRNREITFRKKVILEVGCGAENTIFPVIASYPDAFVYACDFSPRAIELVKTHEDFKESRVRAFVSDLIVDDLCKEILPSSVDIVTMPNGYVLFRDYATGDLSQERFLGKDQKISDNFYVRGDGTRAYYFSNEFLTNLFRENGFAVDKHYKINIYLREYFSEGF
ncbi:uncharacterized protein [Arachis hypogaea]|uniref:uncharacterized protein n=2 Tax=Arachis TaxID=3817 RepID=UPI003B21BBE4